MINEFKIEAQHHEKKEEVSHKHYEILHQHVHKIREHGGEVNKISLFLIGLVAILIVFNQIQINSVAASINGVGPTGSFMYKGSSGSVDLKNVDVTQIQSTAQGIATLFPVDEIKTADDAIAVMIQTGTPEYGEAMGVSFDDPVASMESMAAAYGALKNQAQEDPGVWQRYLSLAAAPTGISCEFCCGIGAQGIDSKGNSRCGCKHNPALQTVTLWLMMNTDYSDAEILKEAYEWKAIWFPKNMVGLASQIAGGDTSVLEHLPGMVGGC
jgi:hypothetical protein